MLIELRPRPYLFEVYNWEGREGPSEGAARADFNRSLRPEGVQRVSSGGSSGGKVTGDERGRCH